MQICATKPSTALRYWYILSMLLGRLQKLYFKQEPSGRWRIPSPAQPPCQRLSLRDMPKSSTTSNYPHTFHSSTSTVFSHNRGVNNLFFPRRFLVVGHPVVWEKQTRVYGLKQYENTGSEIVASRLGLRRGPFCSFALTRIRARAYVYYRYEPPECQPLNRSNSQLAYLQ